MATGWWALVALAAACSNSSSGNSGNTGCVANATQLCYCAAGVQGIQVCQGGAFGWSVCDCGSGFAGDGGSSGDAKTSDAKPSDATADSQSSDSQSSDSQATDASNSGGADSVSDATGKDGQLQDTTTADGGGGNGGVDDASEGSDVDWSELLDPEDTGSGSSGGGGSDGGGSGGGGSGGGGGGDDCPERAKIVYVVTESNQLLSFSPEQLKFDLVGTLKCPPSVGAQPFSMAVDRQANAYVLYSTAFGGGGGVCKVSTLDASGQGTTYIPGIQGFELFGMGFSANQAALPDESLWIGGTKASLYNNAANTCYLGFLDGNSLQPTKVAAFPAGWGCPELTGNGMAELYGFFPNASPPAVGKIDKATAQITKAWPLPAAFSTGLAAWAFAQWGGQLWLFFKGAGDPSTNVWTLDTKTGSVVKVLPNIGKIIVGAGVSSCAPSASKTP
jgi:hypothetical protein